jgi:hypothetical protein
MEQLQHEQPAEAAGAAGVILRVKRRRDYQAPQQIGTNILVTALNKLSSCHGVLHA